MPVPPFSFPPSSLPPSAPTYYPVPREHIYTRRTLTLLLFRHRIPACLCADRAAPKFQSPACTSNSTEFQDAFLCFLTFSSDISSALILRSTSGGFFPPFVFQDQCLLHRYHELRRRPRSHQIYRVHDQSARPLQGRDYIPVRSLAKASSVSRC